jgi:hypothetical protein
MRHAVELTYPENSEDLTLCVDSSKTRLDLSRENLCNLGYPGITGSDGGFMERMTLLFDPVDAYPDEARLLCRIKCLDLRMNSVGAAGAAVLASMLRRNNTLTALNLDGNAIGNTGCVSISSALENDNTTLVRYREPSQNPEINAATI